jgi:hypothetical protein
MPAGGAHAATGDVRPAGRGVAIAAGLVALAVCGWFEAGLAPFRFGSSAVTFSVAAAVLATSAVCGRMRRPVPDPPGRLLPGTLAWLSAALFGLAVELWELLHGPRHLYPTLSSIANDVIGPGHRIARATAFVCWGACGFIVASRPGRRP